MQLGIGGKRRSSKAESARLARMRILARSVRYTVEELESRIILSATGVGAIPATILANNFGLTLFAPGTTESTISANPTGASVVVYPFAMNSVNPNDSTQLAQFHVYPSAGGFSSNDAALGLYDSNGNLIQSVDQDLVPGANDDETLSSPIANNQSYYLAAYFGQTGSGPTGPQVQYNLDVTTPPQNVGTPINVDPSSGTASVLDDTVGNAFSGNADVHYYALNLLNEGTGGTVTLSPDGPGVAITATLFQRASDSDPWVQAATVIGGTGVPANLNLPAETGKSLTDFQFMLAVVPSNFSGAAGAYQIDVAGATLLGPSTISLTVPPPESSPNPIDLGIAGVTYAGSLAGGPSADSQDFTFLAPAAGSTTVALTSPSFFSVVSVYNADGSTLLAVGSDTTHNTASATFTAAANTAYSVRVGMVNNVGSGTYSLSINTPYNPISLPLTNTVTTVSNLAVDSTQAGTYYDLQSVGNTDVLAIEVDCANADVTLTLFGTNTAGGAITQTVKAGKNTVVSFDISGDSDQLALEIGSSSGAGTATLKIGKIIVPIAYAPSSLTGALQDLTGLADAEVPTHGFGTSNGLSYYGLVNAGGATEFLADSSNFAAPAVLAHYEMSNGQFVLEGIETSSGDHSVVTTAATAAQTLEGVVAFQTGFDPNETMAVAAGGPIPTPVGVGMVPDLTEKPTPLHAILKISGVTLAADFQQSLWQAFLPANINGLPIVTLTPSGTTNGIQATVNVFFADDLTHPIATFTNAPGQPAVVTLATPFSQFAGQTLAFQVTPVAGKLGDGTYTLQMRVPTPDETTFDFPGPLPTYNTLSDFPGITDIIQDPNGTGTATGDFTNPVPQKPGSFEVFRFWETNPGPFDVQTSDIDPSANTEIALYQAHFNPSTHVMDSVVPVQNFGPSKDWDPESRSPIDSRIHVTNFVTAAYPDQNPPGSMLTNDAYEPYGNGGGEYFVIVKNEQGSLGRYSVTVTGPAFQPLSANPGGVGNLYQLATSGQLNDVPASGSLTINLPFLNNPLVETNLTNEFLGYYPLQLPLYHGTARDVQLSPSAGTFNLEAYDASNPGVALPSAAFFDVEEFTVSPTASTIYLRVQEKSDATNLSTLTVSTNMPLRFAGNDLPATLAAATPLFGFIQELPSTIFGDASLNDIPLYLTTAQAFSFQASDGMLNLNIAPSTDIDSDLQWGVYVDGNLVATNTIITQGLDAGFDQSTRNASILIGDLPLPVTPDDSVMPGQYKDVVVLVKPVNPTGSGAGGSVSISADATRPLPVAGDSEMSTTEEHSTSLGVGDGNTWKRLITPDHMDPNFPLTLDVTFGGNDLGGTLVQLELYDSSGNAIFPPGSYIESSSSSNLNHVTFTLPDYDVASGSAYYIRVSVQDETNVSIAWTANALLDKLDPLEVFHVDTPDFEPPNVTADDLTSTIVAPDGSFATGIFTNTDIYGNITLWVGNSGVATFHATFDTSAASIDSFLPSLSLYRAGDLSGIEFADQIGLTLVDYVNTANLDNDGVTLDLSHFLEPGLYVLEAHRANAIGTGHVAISGQIPAYIAQTILLDPNSGTSSVEQLNVVDNVVANDLVSEYRTTYYQVTAPNGTIGPFTAIANDSLDSAAGSALLDVYDQSTGGTFSNLASDTLTVHSIPSTSADKTEAMAGFATPVAEETFWIGVSRFGLESRITTSAGFVIPQSGTPDLVVSPLHLFPDNGKTRIEVVVSNKGYAESAQVASDFTYVDGVNSANSLNGLQKEFALGAFASRTYEFYSIPKSFRDGWFYVTDIGPNGPTILELSYLNNSAGIELASVDDANPTVALSLTNPNYDENISSAYWGRYISGVPGLHTIIDVASTSAAALLNVQGYTPLYDPAQASPDENFTGLLPQDDNQIPLDFGTLLPTSPLNPNFVKFTAQDVYGLMSPLAEEIIQVEALPGWLANAPSSVDWNPTKFRYELRFDEKPIDESETLDTLTGTDIPLIGNDTNEFLVELYSETDVRLNPTDTINVAMNAHIDLTFVGRNVFDVRYKAGDAPVDNISLSSTVVIDPVTLDAKNLAITFALKNFNLLDWESPKIPIFSYGLPGVASIYADFYFSVHATLNAALTFGIDTTGAGAGVPVKLGIEAPTFLQVVVTAGANVEGSLEVIGFDLASVSGGINVVLKPTIGLTTQPGQIVDLSDLGDKIGFGMGIGLNLDIEAKVLGFTVFSLTSPTINIANLGSTVYIPPGFSVSSGATSSSARSKLVTAAVVQPVSPGNPDDGTEVINGGGDVVGPIDLDSTPNVVINPTTGAGVYVQDVNASSTAGSGGMLGNVAVESRTGTNQPWSTLTTLSSPNHDSAPTAALTYDNTATNSAVLVYDATDSTDDPQTLTRNQFLDDQDIRYRYFDGNTWSSEQSVTSDGAYDTGQVVAFNKSGVGVLAWTHNTNTTATLDGVGQLDRSSNDIDVSVWDKTTHTWSAPFALTSPDGVSDSSPAVYVDENGKSYVSWLRDSGSGNVIMTATYSNGAWSTPTQLLTQGLVPGGKIGELAYGSNGAGQISLLFSDKKSTPAIPATLTTPAVPGQPAISILYSRSSTLGGYLANTPVVTVSQGENYSHLSTTSAADGTLVAYWQADTGATNMVEAAMLPSTAMSAAPVFTVEQPVAIDGDMQFNPSLAVEPDNTFDVVYQRDYVTAPTGPAHDVRISGLQSMGDVASSTVEMLPELSFSKPLHFDDQATAPGGSIVMGHATVANTGAAAAVVQIDFYNGIAGQGGTQFDTETVDLAPGTSFDINEPFTVQKDLKQYSIMVTAVGTGEAITTADDVTSASLIGLTDLTVSSVTVTPGGGGAVGPGGGIGIGGGGGGSLPQPGSTADVQVVITNDSDLPVNGPFDVSLNVPPQAFGFADPVDIQAGAHPQSVVAADVNGDGIPDLVVTNEADGTVSVMLGNGDGTFQPQQTFATGIYPSKTVVVDVNHDGNPDLVVANGDGVGTISVLLGDGHGNFGSQTTFTIGYGVRDIALADVNGDGTPDLIVANASSTYGYIGVLLGNGDGTFQNQVTYAAGRGPDSLAIGDLNGDMQPDIVVANEVDNTVGVLLNLNDGTGGFEPMVTLDTDGSTPVSVALADVNGDHHLDIVVANRGSNNVSVFLGQGGGTFQPEQRYDTGSGTYPTSVAVADINGDGFADIVTANYGNSTLSVILGNGDGTFGAPQPQSADSGTYSIAIADLNGDMAPDLISANVNASDISVLFGQLPDHSNDNLTTLSVPGGLAAGQSVTLDFAWTIPDGGGNFLLVATADSGNAIVEGNELNNVGITTLDLTPDPSFASRGEGGSSINLFLGNGLTNIGAQSVFVGSEIFNNGTATATNVPVELQWSLDGGPFVDVADQTIASIAPNGSTFVSFNTGGLAGVNSYRLVIDPNITENDADLSNNVTEGALSISGLPDLSGALAFQTSTFIQGRPLTADMTVFNTGIAGADNVLVQVYAQSADLQGFGERSVNNAPVLIGSMVLSHIDALSSQEMFIPLNTADLSGNETISFVIDPLQTILETNKDNNTAQTTVVFQHALTEVPEAGAFVEVGVGGAIGPDHLVGPAETLNYEIAFAEGATSQAPAQGVYIAQELSGNLDPNTFQFTSFTFDGQTYTIAANSTSFNMVIDLSASKGFDVQVIGVFNPNTAVLDCEFITLDPNTGHFPQDPTIGFLAPNIDNLQAGFLTYSAQPKATDTDGSTIAFVPLVEFDGGLATMFPAEVDETLDTIAPTSAVSPLPETEPTGTFTVSWSGQDNEGGAGLATYSIFVSDNGGDYTPFVLDTAATSATFNGTPGHTYSFYSIATDKVGNQEIATIRPQTSTAVSSTPSTPAFSNLTTSYAASYGTATATFSGNIAANSLIPPGTEVVSITFNGVSQDALIGPTGDFSSTFDTSVLPASVASYAVTYTYAGDSNFNPVSDSSTTALTVKQATATVMLGSLAQNYSGSAEFATAITGPEGLAVTIVYMQNSVVVANPTNAGSYSVVATINDPNYQGAASGTLVIGKANATVMLQKLGQLYTGSAEFATATTSLAGLALTLVYTQNSVVVASPTNAGSYTVVATINDPNYQGSATGTLVIGKASVLLVLGSLAQMYSGAPEFATATTAPGGLTVVFVYSQNGVVVANPTNAGNYIVVATINDPNYQGDATGTLTITDGAVTVTLASPPSIITYDGNSDVTSWVKATLAGQAGAPAPTGAATFFYYSGSSVSGTGSPQAPVQAGTYTVVAVYAGDSNYQPGQSTPLTFTINRATPTVTLPAPPASIVANGTTQVTAWVVPALTGATGAPAPSGMVTLSYYSGNVLLASSPTSAGAYTVVASYAGNSNYGPASTSESFTITSAAVGALTVSMTVNNGAAQRSMVTSLTLTFNVHVGSLPAGAITLMDTTTNQAVTGFTVTAGPGNTWILTFAGGSFIGDSLANGRYTLTVHAAALGMQSGDMLASDQSFSFFRLYGSLSGDSTVSAADYNLYTAAVRAGVASMLYTQYAGYLDYYGNNNGAIDSDDVTLFAAAYKNKQSV